MEVMVGNDDDDDDDVMLVDVKQFSKSSSYQVIKSNRHTLAGGFFFL